MWVGESRLEASSDGCPVEDEVHLTPLCLKNWAPVPSLEWGSKVQVEIGHLNVCMGAALLCNGAVEPMGAELMAVLVLLNTRVQDLSGAAIPPAYNFLLLMSPEIQLTWGINLEKPHSLQTVALCCPFYPPMGQLSSEWSTKSDVMISDGILCSSLTNSKPPLRPCSMAVSAAGTSKFQLSCPERVGNVSVPFVENEPCSSSCWFL